MRIGPERTDPRTVPYDHAAVAAAAILSATPEDHIGSSVVLSRSVSIVCQKPV
jgi:hypothetical protein